MKVTLIITNEFVMGQTGSTAWLEQKKDYRILREGQSYDNTEEHKSSRVEVMHVDMEEVPQILEDHDIEYKECRYISCDLPRRSYEHNENLDGFGAKFCSNKHELKFEHIKADAEDARIDKERRMEPDRRN